VLLGTDPARGGETVPLLIEAALVYYKAAVQGGRLDAAFAITEILRHASEAPGGPGPGPD
jgi:hypothetical protein